MGDNTVHESVYKILENIKKTTQELCKKLEKDADDVVSQIAERRREFEKKLQRLKRAGHIDKKTLGIEDRLARGIDDKNKTVVQQETILEDITGEVQQVKVKQEKISNSSITSFHSARSSGSSITEMKENIAIKIESDAMPAPTWIPPTKKKNIKREKAAKKTRTKGKKVSSSSERNSDVIIQNPVVPSIDLSDNEDSDGEKQDKQRSTRSTRTKTRYTAQEPQSDVRRTTRSRAVQNEIETTNQGEEEVRSSRTKTRKAKNQEEDQTDKEVPQEVRTTRTKTLKKTTKKQNDSKEESNSETETNPEVRTTRTKTLNKPTREINERKEETNSEPEANQEVRTTRTKTLKKATEKTNDDKNGSSSESESNRELRSTRTKTIKKATNEQNEVKEETEANQEVRTTRTKTIRKAAPKEVQDGRQTEESDNESVRSTYTKTKKKIEKEQEEKEEAVSTQQNGTEPDNATKKEKAVEQSKRRRSSDGESDEKVEKKKSKSISPVPNEIPVVTEKTEYDDALDILSVTTTTRLFNSTVTISKSSKFNIFAHSPDPLFTEDESVTEPPKTPPKKKNNKIKEVFSPYAKTTLKKKVEAFEKLQSNVNAQTKLKQTRCTPIGAKDKMKYTTPTASKFNPISSSTSKISRMIPNPAGNDSLLAIKAIQKESREKQRKALEREQAAKKKEAMLQATAEAKRKINEEKQLRAQQQRKFLEAQKQKQVELQKVKEERQKQKEAEREEYQQKQRLELEKKRQAQKKKLQEMQLQRQQQNEQAKPPPVYLMIRAPPLPTEDCYDSDDSNYVRPAIPAWCRSNYAKTREMALRSLGEVMKNTWFCMRAETPDLREIFESIDPKKLKRTSSMYWRPPPRYTQIPDLNNTRFSDDDELYEDDEDS